MTLVIVCVCVCVLSQGTVPEGEMVEARIVSKSPSSSFIPRRHKS